MNAREAYLSSWSRRGFVVPILLAVRLLSFALIAPITGILASVAVSFSGQAALTDLDIAQYLLTPIGFLASLGVVVIFLASSFVAFVAMTANLRERNAQGFRALYTALLIMTGRLIPLFGYSALLVLRILAIVLPFVLLSLMVASQLMGSHDINYYISAKPPDLYATAAIIIFLLFVMAAILVKYLLGWALSLHMVLFADVGPNPAFIESRRNMAGKRVRLLRTLLIGLGIHIGLTISLAFIFGWLLQTLPGIFEELRTSLTILLVIAGAWALAGMVVTAVSLGALALIIDSIYRETDACEPVSLSTEQRGFSLPLVLTACLALVIFGLASGGTMLEQIQTKDEVQIIAHRGAAGARPENTIASIRKAIEDKADWVEIDVQETADGEVVVIHDSDFKKLAGVDIKIWNATKKDLAKIDVGSWFDPVYGSERTPTLAEILEIARNRAKVLVELKYYGHDVDLEARTAAVIDRAGMAEQVAIMSLKYPAIQKMRAISPSWRTGILAATAIGNLTGLEGDFIAVRAARVSPRLVADSRAVGKDLYVWTVNEPLKISAMISMGVDGIITDEPALARQVLAVRASMSSAQRLLLLIAERLGFSLRNDGYRDTSP